MLNCIVTIHQCTKLLPQEERAREGVVVAINGIANCALPPIGETPQLRGGGIEIASIVASPAAFLSPLSRVWLAATTTSRTHTATSSPGPIHHSWLPIRPPEIYKSLSLASIQNNKLDFLSTHVCEVLWPAVSNSGFCSIVRESLLLLLKDLFADARVFS